MQSLKDHQGNEAAFTDAGELTCLRSHGQTWSPQAPSAGWSLTFVVDGEHIVARPLPGSGSVSPAVDGRLTVSYDCVATEQAGEIRVDVTVTWWLEAGLLHGALTAEHLPADAVLHAAAIPDVTFAYGDTTWLVVPHQCGMLVPDAAHEYFEEPDPRFPARFRYPDHYHFQCFGWKDGERGLYHDCRDDRGHIKEWSFTPERKGVFRLRVEHFAPRELDPPGRFAVPYPVTLGGFDGGWYEVGRIYRGWAIQRTWASRGPETRREEPIADVACWLWNRGGIAEVAPVAKAFQERLGLPVALDWYWWHQHAYDTEYPDYFPPREGQGAFRAAVRDLQSAGLFVQVYTNGMCCDMDGAAWLPEGPRCVVVREDGEVDHLVYNSFMKHRLGHACGASEEWRRIVCEIADQARGMGLDGLYLDMISACGGGAPCFNKHHAHAPGGGCYGVEGFRSLLQEIRAAHPGLALSSEETGECYMDLLDAHISLQTSLERSTYPIGWFFGETAEAVPLFPAIYHGRCIVFGNYTFFDGIPPFDDLWPREFRYPPEEEKDWMALCPDQTAFELARTVGFGQQPLIANLTMEHLTGERFAPEVKFLLALCRFYHAHRELLLWGDMLPPGRLECDRREIAFLVRSIFTAPGEEKVRRRMYPGLLHSAWRSPAGEAGAILINYSRTATPFTYTPPDGYIVNGGPITGSMPPRSIRLIPLSLPLRPLQC